MQKRCYFIPTRLGKIKKSEKYKLFVSGRAMETLILLVGIKNTNTNYKHVHILPSNNSPKILF